MIGNRAFLYCSELTSSIPQVMIGNRAFYCSELTSVTIPQATSIEFSAFSDCTELASVHMGQNAPAEAIDVFAYITPPPTVHVTDPQATGWGTVERCAGRPPLYAEAIYQAGELVATTAALAVHTNRADNPHGVTAVQIGALTAELDPVANTALTAHTNRADNPHSVTAVQNRCVNRRTGPRCKCRAYRTQKTVPTTRTCTQIGAITKQVWPRCGRTTTEVRISSRVRRGGSFSTGPGRSRRSTLRPRVCSVRGVPAGYRGECV